MYSLIDLYSDYLIVNQGQATATGLSALVDNQITHDSITRQLSSQDYGSYHLWQKVKTLVRSIATPEAVFIVDDTVQAKPYMDENKLICYHYDHCIGKTVKGINQLSGLYHSQNASVPTGYYLITKPEVIVDPKTGKNKRISPISKQAHFRRLIRQALINKLIFKYVLADSWFCSAENINFLAHQHCQFIMPIKTNRNLYLSQSDKALGLDQPIESLAFEPDCALVVWINEVDFPLLLTKQIFKDGENGQVVQYLLSNDLTADPVSIQTYYTRRWKIEEFHKSLKSNLGYAHSPAHGVRTQSNHLFLVLLAFVKLESLKIRSKSNHFALKKKLTLNALKRVWQQLQQLKEAKMAISYA